ncbi:VWA domain-containing protein [Streptomyces sp. NPDC001812]|uniref:VWA domain-containing protein n=1 Tax=Streptomyces cathayae TaxID=3031124 RepID=A0ABY8JW41_9ACTN|nr:VWA domain-containing protein [Streptomyces sp. HUAS 5]WGD39867.1 VWA domain-containing protein [Streptomyces sp. HUAS 5]
MSLLGFTPAGTRLVTATGQGLVDGNRLAVGAGRLAAETAGLLLPRGAASSRSVAVRLVPTAGLPEDVVVVPEALADEHRLADASWVLQPADATVPATIELESPAELSLDEAARQLQNSALLSGHVLAYGHQHEDVWIDLGGHPFRVRSALDGSGRPVHGVLRVGADTHVSVFAPGVRSAVDIVVLADCSGSMGVTDIPDVRESIRITRNREVSRMDALKSALRSMIDAREQVDGLVTRFALISFELTPRVIFPGGDGMAEVTTAPGDRSLEQLRGAVTLLKEYDGRPTDIGRALHRAAELLHRHGVPDNDKLIVLVSDGAHWAPMSEDRSGESVAGIDDPVSTMEELHTHLGFRLHAVGISDQTLFASWWDDYCRQRGQRLVPPESLVPNHGLLQQLVEVTGGDRHRIGGMEVLEEYFRELGSGVMRSVGRPAPARLPALQVDPARVAAEPRRASVDPAQQQDWESLVETVLERYSEVCTASVPRLGYALFDAAPPTDLKRLRRIALTHMDFTAWVAAADKIFHERLDEAVRFPRSNPKYIAKLPLPELAEPLWDGRLGEVHGLRNYYLHNPEYEKRKPEQNREVGEVLLKHTGRYSIGEEEAEGWRLLQRGLLNNLSGMLSDVHSLLVSPPPGFPVPTLPAPAPITGPLEPKHVEQQGW